MVKESVLLLLSLLALGANSQDCLEQNARFLADYTNNGFQNSKVSAQACQSACLSDARCNYFTWFSSSYTQYEGYENSCWFMEDEPQTQAAPGAISGPSSCSTATSGPNTCCTYLNIYSPSILTQGEQEDRFGDYQMYRTEANGYYSYKQVNGPNYLFFLTDSNLWMVGEQLLVDYGGILNRGSGMCPEDLSPNTFWEYWDDFFERWEEDPFLGATCPSEITTPPGTISPPEDCTSGTICLGCDQTTEIEGILFCCETDCDTGWIEGGSDNGEPWCKCGHD